MCVCAESQGEKKKKRERKMMMMVHEKIRKRGRKKELKRKGECGEIPRQQNLEGKSSSPCPASYPVGPAPTTRVGPAASAPLLPSFLTVLNLLLTLPSPSSASFSWRCPRL